MRQTEGIYGGRFSGVGFKGCMVFIDPFYAEKVKQQVARPI